ncbi:hypothetical protein [Flavobacterium franklandianum]|uniref:hypothetical protein n=1 Tax=Flavobacterium franklandianum TaxID=2594430 RepID=UPI00163D74D2|nr:hypothetical protein [Flavobacterium franklandianum]
MKSLVVQNIPSPSDNFLPRLVSIISVEDVKQSKPISNTVNAMKNVCTVIICRLIKLKDLSSLSQLKYFGKKM